MEDDGLRAALRLGHNLVKDMPASGAAFRWTCSRCQRAVLMPLSKTHQYGSATKEECKK